MITKEIRRQRCQDALKILMEYNDCVFFTLTTPDKVDFDTIRARWRALRHELMRALRRIYGKGFKIHYVMNFEAHTGYLQKLVKDPRTVERVLRSDGQSHGWHIHGVLNCYLSLDRFLPLIKSFGFGRVDVRRVTSRGVSDYLTKHALKAYSGLSEREKKIYAGARRRLVNTSRGLPSLNDYAYHSDLIEQTRPIMSEAREAEHVRDGEVLHFKDYRRLYQRSQVCALLGLRHSWQLIRVFEWLNSYGSQGLPGLIARLTWRDIFDN